MSILIHGVGIPTNCLDCPIVKIGVDGHIACRAKGIIFGKEDYDWIGKRTPNWCPIEKVEDTADEQARQHDW